MTNTKELLTMLKAHYDGASDYKISKILGISHQAVYAWKQGKTAMSDEAAIKTAEILDIDVDYVLLSVYAERTKGDVASQVFARAAENARPYNSPLSLCQQRDFFKIA